MITFFDLKHYEVFSGLNVEEQWRLSQIARLVHGYEGKTLFKEGAPANALYLLIKGGLMVVFKDERAITLHEPGRVVGWSALTNDSTYTASVVCLTDCDLLTFPGSDLLGLLRAHINMGNKIMNEISKIIARRISFISEEKGHKLDGWSLG